MDTFYENGHKGKGQKAYTHIHDALGIEYDIYTYICDMIIYDSTSKQNLVNISLYTSTCMHDIFAEWIKYMD